MTDSTAGGTSLVKDIKPGAAFSFPTSITANGNGKALFQATDGIHGLELWVSDGTAAGTTMLKDINIGSGDSSPSGFSVLPDGRVVFEAADATNGRELWVTDGTTAGTKLVEDINPGIRSSTPVGFAVEPAAPGSLADGVHSITATATSFGNVSAPSSALQLTIDTVSPPPVSLALASTSDSGVQDGITNDNMPTLTGTAATGSLFTLYDTDGATILGTATAVDGLSSITPGVPLSDGTHSLTVTDKDLAGNTSDASAPLQITIDTVLEPAAALSLAPASDSGTPDNNVTNRPGPPTIIGTGEDGAIVTLLDGGIPIGTGSVIADGTWPITANTVLTAGVNSFTAAQTDLAGNTSAASIALEVTLDTTPPRVTILVVDDALAAGQTSPVTFTFSEAATNFDNRDLTVEGGMLSEVASTDGGITWTAVLTPNANTTDTSNLITLTNTGVEDGAGNPGIGTTIFNNFIIDTTTPEAPTDHG